jgi:hypothetical protein
MRQSLILTSLLILLIACSKKNDEPIRKFTSFQVDSQIVVAENPVAILSSPNLTDDDPDNDSPVLTMTATGIRGEVIQFRLITESATIIPGLYTSANPGNLFRIGYTSTAYNLQASHDYGNLQFRVTSVQDSLIEGSFTGTVADSTGTISPRKLSDGFIRAVFKRDTI